MARRGPLIADSASRQPIGPAPQLTPTTSTSSATIAWAASAGVVPSGSSSSSPKVSRAMIGRSAARRASSMAIRRWSRTEKVSNWNRSTPPSSSPSSVSRNAARTAVSSRCRISRVGAPSGPIEPATRTSRPATSRASRASCAPRRARRPAWSASPYGARRCRLAPKVAVSMMSAPAARYSRWIAPIRSGRVWTSSSREARWGTPRENRRVPIAPSANSGPAGKAVPEAGPGVASVRFVHRGLLLHQSAARLGDSQRAATSRAIPLR